MSDCQACQDRMIEALYGELGPAEKERFEGHRQACPECAAAYATLDETLRLMDRRDRPDPGPAFWDGYWDRLSRRMVWEAAEEGRRPSLAVRIGLAFTRLPRWAYQVAGAAALVIVGVVIGSFLIGPPGRTGKMDAAARALASPAGAVVQAGEFIERSKVLLLGLVNFDPATEDAYALDLGRKKAVSRELLAEVPAIRSGLSDRSQKRLRELVSDLEVILLQIANLGSGQDVEGVELIKQGVDGKGLFLKIDLDRLGREARGPAAPAKKGI